MKIFKRESDDPVRETCPVFFVDGEEIVDVRLASFVGSSDGRQWDLEDKIDVTVTRPFDTVVVESPAGCFMNKFPLHSGDRLVLSSPVQGSSMEWEPCSQARSWSADIEETTSNEAGLL